MICKRCCRYLSIDLAEALYKGVECRGVAAQNGSFIPRRSRTVLLSKCAEQTKEQSTKLSLFPHASYSSLVSVLSWKIESGRLYSQLLIQSDHQSND